MSRADITETCGCGATLHVVMDSIAYAQDEAKQFRRDHRHIVIPPGPPEDAECCASGRCEVCSPGYVWGRD